MWEFTFRILHERTDGDTSVFTLVVPADSPFFEGHFPGRPVLPAIGQLAMLAALVRQAAAPTAILIGVDGLRLSRQVSPDEELEVRLDTRRAPRAAAFEIRCGGTPVSRGTLRLAAGPGR